MKTVQSKPEWEIEKSEFLRRLGCGEADFQKLLYLPDIRVVKRVVPLRHLKAVDSILPITRDMLFGLVSRIATVSGEKPFLDSQLQLCKMDPNHLKIGQRFVYRENYQSLLEELPDLFGKFVVGTGLNDLGAYFVFGEDLDGLPALACYIPPLIEQHGPELIIMDGIHRAFIVKQTGAAINAIIIRNVSVPFPCGMHPWSDIRVIGLADKPKDINERYFELKKELFRDLKYLGIDG